MQNNKKGFTLLEMMLVVGIIVILSAVGLIAVGDTIRKSKEKQEEYRSYTNVVTQAQERVHNILAVTVAVRTPAPTTPRPTTPSPTLSPTEATDPTGSSETTAEGAGGIYDETIPSTSETTESSESSESSETTADPAADIPYGDKLVVHGLATEGLGARSVSYNESTGVYTIVIQKNQYETVTVTVDKYGVINIVEGGSYILSGGGLNIPNKPSILTPEQLEILNSNFNIEFNNLETLSLDGPVNVTASVGYSGSWSEGTGGNYGVNIDKDSIPLGAQTVTIVVRYPGANITSEVTNATVSGDTITYVYNVDSVPSSVSSGISGTGIGDRPDITVIAN